MLLCSVKIFMEEYPMSEEKKENLTPDAENENLHKELEELKDTFQAAYDETVIQMLFLH